MQVDVVYGDASKTNAVALDFNSNGGGGGREFKTVVGCQIGCTGRGVSYIRSGGWVGKLRSV